jgi:hypothetical protein
LAVRPHVFARSASREGFNLIEIEGISVLDDPYQVLLAVINDMLKKTQAVVLLNRF